MITRRQQLIQQMRCALNDLQRPEYADYHDDIVFEIADMEFNFTMDDLDEDLWVEIV